MTDQSPTRVGIDYRDGVFYAARVRHGSGRPEVLALVRYDEKHLGEHHLLKDGEIVMSVPDDTVLIKDLEIPPGGGVPDLARVEFELAQSVLEDDSAYLFDSLESGIEGHYLGMLMRREADTNSPAAVFTRAAGLDREPHRRIRGAALGQGYLAFCSPEKGDLTCLIDITKKLATFCFLYRRAIIGLAHLALGGIDPGSPDGRERLAIEAKTVINFKTASFFESGVTLPLSAVLVSGIADGDPFLDVLSRYFAVPVGRPEVNRGFFSKPEQVAGIPLGQYLVALGLGTNSLA